MKGYLPFLKNDRVKLSQTSYKSRSLCRQRVKDSRSASSFCINKNMLELHLKNGLFHDYFISSVNRTRLVYTKLKLIELIDSRCCTFHFCLDKIYSFSNINILALILFIFIYILISAVQ